MGSTRKNITKIYENNSATATTVDKYVESEMVVVTKNIAGDTTYTEIGSKADTNPGVVGGIKHQN